ncbi:MAG: SpoIIE family protein phosphatase [Bacteroidales bacterium]|nr:SpoIIE family protein phosphatase [Bacteroidales bacterium]
MVKRLLFVTALLFATLGLHAHQIDEAEHYYVQLKEMSSSESFSTDYIRELTDKLATATPQYLQEIFGQLSLECERRSDEETGYYTSLVAAVCFYDRGMYSDAIKYANLAVSFNHQADRCTYLEFLKGKLYLKQKKYDLAYQSLAIVMEAPDSETNKLLKCETYRSLAEYYEHCYNTVKALECLNYYTALQDTIHCSSLDKNCCLLPQYMQSKYIDRQIFISGYDTINELQDENEQQNTTIIILAMGGVLALSFSTLAACKWVSLSKANTKLSIHNQGIESRQNELAAAQAGLASLSLIAEQTSNAFLTADHTGKITWVNKGFEKLYNKNLREYILENGENLFYSTDTSRKTALENCRELKKTQICQFKFTGAKEPKWILSTISPVLESDHINQYVIIENDITDIKTSELKLIENNSRITGSIRSAHIIQQLLLPLPQTICKYYPSFVIYKPKDIVSGDFYWFNHNADNNTSIIAVGDCTGHGVPGAMMSVLMIRILDEIAAAKTDPSPAQILTDMQDKVVEMLKQRQTDNTDGLDITIAKIVRHDNDAELTLAGAKSYFAYYQKSSNTTQLVKGTKKSIGGTDESQKTFEDRVLNLAKGDRIFLSSDGFIDQNNPERKCIGSQRFTSIINQSAQKSLSEQKEFIENALAQWQQNEPQRDDICVVALQM